jgi:hypothetical protein
MSNIVLCPATELVTFLICQEFKQVNFFRLKQLLLSKLHFKIVFELLLTERQNANSLHEKNISWSKQKAANKGHKIQFSITPPHLHFLHLGPTRCSRMLLLDAGSQGRLDEKFIALRKKTEPIPDKT